MKRIYLHELMRAGLESNPSRYDQRLRVVRISDDSWLNIDGAPSSVTVNDLEFTAKRFVAPNGGASLRWTIECEVIL